MPGGLIEMTIFPPGGKELTQLSKYFGFRPGYGLMDEWSFPTENNIMRHFVLRLFYWPRAII